MQRLYTLVLLLAVVVTAATSTQAGPNDKLRQGERNFSERWKRVVSEPKYRVNPSVLYWQQQQQRIWLQQQLQQATSIVQHQWYQPVLGNCGTSLSCRVSTPVTDFVSPLLANNFSASSVSLMTQTGLQNLGGLWWLQEDDDETFLSNILQQGGLNLVLPMSATTSEVPFGLLESFGSVTARGSSLRALE
jgi:hypothetical protein